MGGFVRLTPDEVLKLIDKQDTTDLSRYLCALGAHDREEWLIERYLDQYFAAWDSYHKWLVGEVL